MRRGATLVELLITIVISLVVLSAVYLTYIKLFKGFKTGTVSQITELQKAAGSEIVRLDVEHAGFGIAYMDKDHYRPIEWSSANRTLTIRSTLNLTSQPTVGWALVNCNSGTGTISHSEILSGSKPYVVFLTLDKKFVANSNSKFVPDSAGNIACPSYNGYLLVFPYSDNATGTGCCVEDNSTTACSTYQECNKITYRLSKTQNLSYCNPSTKNLLRAVGKSNGTPIINCVNDFNVRFTFDINNDGQIEPNERDANIGNLSVYSAEDIGKRLKEVHIFALHQVGKYNPDYKFTNYKMVNGTAYVEVPLENGDTLNLKLPNKFKHYKWEVLNMSVEPMDINLGE